MFINFWDCQAGSSWMGWHLGKWNWHRPGGLRFNIIITLLWGFQSPNLVRHSSPPGSYNWSLWQSAANIYPSVPRVHPIHIHVHVYWFTYKQYYQSIAFAGLKDSKCRLSSYLLLSSFWPASVLGKPQKVLFCSNLQQKQHINSILVYLPTIYAAGKRESNCKWGVLVISWSIIIIYTLSSLCRTSKPTKCLEIGVWQSSVINSVRL